MSKVNVVIVDATGNKEQKVGLPDDIKCGIIMVKLIEKIKLPSVGPDGNPISYKFIHKVTGRQLLEAQTLAEAGIKDGDVLRLQPEITAGAFCPKCGSEVNEGTPYCDKCGFNVIPNNTPTPTLQTTYAPPKTSLIDKAINNKNKAKMIFSLLGMISGVISVILGFHSQNKNCIGMYVSDSSYGGDAYTGIQNATAQTANNILGLQSIIRYSTECILIVFGLFMLCFFGYLFFRSLNKEIKNGR